MQEFPQGADRAAGRFGFAETHGLRPWRRRRAPPGLRPRSLPPCSSLPGAGSFSPAPPPAHPCRTAGNRCVPFPRGDTPPPARFCRTAGLRPAGQTVLRTVLGGGLRPPPRRRRAPPALRAALPLQAPRHPHAKAPAGTAGASLCQYSSIGSLSGPAAIFLSVSSSISCRSAVRYGENAALSQP